MKHPDAGSGAAASPARNTAEVVAKPSMDFRRWAVRGARPRLVTLSWMAVIPNVPRR